MARIIRPISMAKALHIPHRSLLALLLAAFGLLACVSSANAYEVAPMRLVLVPAEGRTGSTITVNNTRDRELLVEIHVKRRVIAADGAQSFVEAEADFVVFPPQIAIPAGQSQAFRFEYVGTPALERAQAYVIEVAEVPVLAPGFSGVKFAYNFGVAVYVEPPRAFVQIEAAARIEAGELVIDVENTGSRYALLTEMVLLTQIEGKASRLPPSALADLIADPLVPPGGQRTLRLRLPDLPASGMALAEFRKP